MKPLTVKVGGEIVKAMLVKQNHLTVWVQLEDGNVVKRHIKKHEVQGL